MQHINDRGPSSNGNGTVLHNELAASMERTSAGRWAVPTAENPVSARSHPAPHGDVAVAERVSTAPSDHAADTGNETQAFDADGGSLNGSPQVGGNGRWVPSPTVQLNTSDLVDPGTVQGQEELGQVNGIGAQDLVADEQPLPSSAGHPGYSGNGLDADLNGASSAEAAFFDQPVHGTPDPFGDIPFGDVDQTIHEGASPYDPAGYDNTGFHQAAVPANGFTGVAPTPAAYDQPFGFDQSQPQPHSYNEPPVNQYEQAGGFGVESPFAAADGFDSFDGSAPIDAVDNAGRNFDEEELETGMAARRNAIEWAVVLVAAVLLALVLRAVLLQAFYIPSPSMEDTLLIDDRVLVNKLSYRLNDISLGDIVVFHRTDAEIATSDPDDPKDVIKRVIATEGQRIEIRDNQVLIDDQQLLEPYLDPNVSMADFGPQIVPEGHIFVMGDNRNLSSDSRGETGPVAEDRVVGRAFFLFWPLNRLSAL